MDECGDCVDPQCETTDSGGVFWTGGKNPCNNGYFPTNTAWNRTCLGCTEEGPASNANCNYNPMLLLMMVHVKIHNLHTVSHVVIVVILQILVFVIVLVGWQIVMVLVTKQQLVL